MDVKICRVCLETSEGMVNIFDGILDKSLSIANMISHCTGLRVFRGDSFPKTICPTCREDAINAYEIKRLFEKSHRVFCQMEKDIKEEQDLLEEEIVEISEKDTNEKKEFKKYDFHCQVKNEPVEEGIFEEEHLHTSHSEVDQLNFEVKCEETDDQRNEDTIDQENKAEHSLEDIQHPHKCPHCHKSFSKVKALKLHIRIHKKEQCSYCQKSLYNLQDHIRTHTGERPYECSHCQKTFATQKTLQNHLLTHTGERPYECSHCQKTFSRGRHLRDHIRTHTGERPYKCTHCQKSFHQNRHLQDHIRTHTGERPYKCTQCQSSFSHSQSLQRHIDTHTGERLYKCSQKLCNKSFTRPDTLLEHIRTHTGERPYKCSYCQMGFSLKRYLQLHIRTHKK